MTTHSSTLVWKNSMDRGAWRVTAHGVAKSQTWLSTQAFSSVQSLSCVQLFVIPWTAACQASRPSPTPRVHPNLCPLSRWRHPMISSSVVPFSSCPQSFPTIRVFYNESALCIRWPKYWSFSFSSSPSNEYSGLISFRIDWLISLQSKGLTQVFSNTTVQKHQFFSAQPSLWSHFHIHTWILEKT